MTLGTILGVVAGGKLAAHGFLTRQAVRKVWDEIEALAEAEWVIELSEASRPGAPTRPPSGGAVRDHPERIARRR